MSSDRVNDLKMIRQFNVYVDLVAVCSDATQRIGDAQEDRIAAGCRNCSVEIAVAESKLRGVLPRQVLLLDQLVQCARLSLRRMNRSLSYKTFFEENPGLSKVLLIIHGLYC